MSACNVNECPNTATRRGMCVKHYRRWQRNGSPLVAQTYSKRGATAGERLDEVGWTVDTDSGCWLWNGPRDNRGYGSVWAGGVSEKASRAAYRAWVGPIAEGHVVLHSCDNPPCINPAHLSAGTQQENIDDMVAKRRFKFKVTDDQVLEIRRLYASGTSQRALANQFGTSKANVHGIVTRKNRNYI